MARQTCAVADCILQGRVLCGPLVAEDKIFGYNGRYRRRPSILQKLGVALILNKVRQRRPYKGFCCRSPEPQGVRVSFHVR